MAYDEWHVETQNKTTIGTGDDGGAFGDAECSAGIGEYVY